MVIDIWSLENQSLYQYTYQYTVYRNIVVSVETTESLLYKTFFIYWIDNQWQAEIFTPILAYYTILIEKRI